MARYGPKSLSYAEIGRLCGIPLPALHRIRDGKGSVKVATIEKIARGFDVPVPKLDQTVVHDVPPSPGADLRRAIGILERVAAQLPATEPGEAELVRRLAHRTEETVAGAERKAKAGRRKRGAG